MSAAEDARAELAQRVGHALSEFIDDQAPLNERYYVIGAKHILKKFGLVEQASQPITDEQVEVVLLHRWSMVTGYCACKEHFVLPADFVRHVLEAVRGVQS